MHVSNKAWVCSVCGYVHHGPEPLEMCPVCGAPKEAFEVYAVEAKPSAKPNVRRWQCLNCGFVHSGPEPPEICPVCGSPKDCFEPLIEVAEKPNQVGKAVKVVVVGAGIAGLAAVEAVRAASPNAEITLISKESTLPYYRLNLTRYLAGEITEAELPIKPQSWFAENQVQLLLGAEVSKLLLDQKAVELHQGDVLPFDKLVLAVGAHPFVPPFPGSYREGVTTLRTLADANKILQSGLHKKNCVCIGGGLLGLETAGAIARRGAKVTLLEGHGWLLPRQLNKKAGDILAKHVKRSGIKLITKVRTQEILGDERVRGVLLEDGSVIDSDLVIVTTGIRSNSYLGRKAGLDVNQGIVVDNLLSTSHSDVFAAGDIAEHRGCVYGTWGPAQYQGSIAGMNAVGANAEFAGISRSNALKVLKLELFSIGQIEAKDGSYETIDSETDDSFSRFVFRDSHLVGSILLGDAKIAAQVKKAVESRFDFSDLLGRHPVAEEVIQFVTEHIN
ncbi:MAG: FAD-dependent oxidoreductase [Planctomycetes bacterium]|nr:FAD-dependent oxidoreductase [Planctomycetota bacterium]